jgi:p-aminobenzoyl-glutamate transporter AbgT
MPTMIPYSIWLFISRLILTVLWVSAGSDFGPGASVTYTLPG